MVDALALGASEATHEGENCQWQFGNESSDANLLSIVKFGGRGT